MTQTVLQTHRNIAGQAGKGLELLPHQAVADHDDALLGGALRKLLRIPRPQVALERLEDLRQHMADWVRSLYMRQPCPAARIEVLVVRRDPSKTAASWHNLTTAANTKPAIWFIERPSKMRRIKSSPCGTNRSMPCYTQMLSALLSPLRPACSPNLYPILDRRLNRICP